MNMELGGEGVIRNNMSIGEEASKGMAQGH